MNILLLIWLLLMGMTAYGANTRAAQVPDGWPLLSSCQGSPWPPYCCCHE
ncbi:hypothetical protein ACI2KO_10970 [Pseudomonas piscis]